MLFRACILGGTHWDAKTLQTAQEPLFRRLSWPFLESTRNLLHNAMVFVSNGPLQTLFVAKTGHEKKCKNVQNRARSLVSEVLVAIFGIYAKFASQRNGCYPKRTVVDPIRGQNGSRNKSQMCKTFKTGPNPWIQRFSWLFSESTRNLLHNAMVVIPNGRL